MTINTHNIKYTDRASACRTVRSPHPTLTWTQSSRQVAGLNFVKQFMPSNQNSSSKNQNVLEWCARRRRLRPRRQRRRYGTSKMYIYSRVMKLNQILRQLVLRTVFLCLVCIMHIVRILSFSYRFLFVCSLVIG